MTGGISFPSRDRGRGEKEDDKSASVRMGSKLGARLRDKEMRASTSILSVFVWGQFGLYPALIPVSELWSERREELCNWVDVAGGCGQGSVFRCDPHVQFLGKNNIFESWLACLSVLEWLGWVTASGGWVSHTSLSERQLQLLKDSGQRGPGGDESIFWGLANPAEAEAHGQTDFTRLQEVSRNRAV